MKKKLVIIYCLIQSIFLVSCNNFGSDTPAKKANITENGFTTPLYVDEKPFDQLPNKKGLNGELSLKELANSTYGLIFDNKGFFSDGPSWKCTSVAISENILVTSAHCVEDSFSRIKIYTTNGKVIRVDAKKLSVFKSKDYIKAPAEVKESTLNKFKRISADIAIIRLNKEKLTPYIDYLDGYVSFNQQELNSYIYNPNNKIYGLGWGSREKFHFASVKTGKPFLYFPIGLKDITSANGQLGIKMMQNNLLLYLSTKMSPYWEAINGDGHVSLTNILLYNDTYPSQPGDSGGPVFICKNDENCMLVAVHQGKFNATENRMGLAITYYNPYFMEILSDALR